MHAQPGQRLRIKAADYNGLLELLGRFRSAGRWSGSGMSLPAMATGSGDVLISCPNATSQYAVIGLGTVAITPGDNLEEFLDRPCLVAASPQADKPFAVLQLPARAGAVVPARLTGVTPVRVTGTLAVGDRVGPGTSSVLEKKDDGTAAVLYAESGTGERWALVLLGSAAPAAGGALVTIRFSGTRSGRRYNGNIVKDDGTLGAACQFVFYNEPGIDTLLNANDNVLAMPAPTWLANQPIWGGTGDKYVAILSPWAALR